MLIKIALAIWLAYLTYRSFTMANQTDVDAITARLTGLDTTVTRIATDFGALKTQVAALEAAAAAGTVLDFTAANATIDSLTAHLDAVDPVPHVA